MKKRVSLAVLLIVAMLCAGLVGVYALGSINSDTNTPTVVDGGTEKVVPCNTDNYENDNLKNLIELSENGTVTPPDQMNVVVPQEDEDKQDSENFPTDNGYKVNLKLYDVIVGPYDIVNTETGTQTYDVEKNGKTVTIEFPQLEGHKGEDLLIVVFDKKGVMHVIAASEFDSETGRMTFKLPCNGPFYVLQKLPIVVKDTATSLYPNQEVAEVVSSLPSDEYIELSALTNALGVEGDQFELEDENVKVDIDNYSAATVFADLAVSLNEGEYDYNLSTKIKARLFQDINEVDYERILEYAGVDYDKDAVAKDKDLLADIEPFVLEDAFVYHKDATTGEVSIIYEPEISFDDYDDEEEAALEASTTTEEKTSALDGLVSEVYAVESKYAVDQDKIKIWDIDDVDNKSDDHVSICINGDKYIGMGPFILFMPKSKSFPWWILLIPVAGAAGYGIYKKNKKDKDDNSGNNEQEASNATA